MDEVIQLVSKAENLVIFAGAGVSRGAPSCIPTFAGLMGDYLHAIYPTDDLMRRFVGAEFDAIHRAFLELPITEFFATLRSMFGDEPLKALHWMNSREPNRVHRQIAKMSTEYRLQTILTTNFDLILDNLLESFESHDLAKSWSKSRWSNKCIDSSANAIFHLHGMIGEDLGITSADLVNSYDHFHHAILADRLDNATVLFVGYSGAYDPDVHDLLKRCPLQNAVWIIHESKSSPHQVQPPRAWSDMFSGTCLAVAGETTSILDAFTVMNRTAESTGDSMAFRRAVTKHLLNMSENDRLYALSTFLSQIHRGDLALGPLKLLTDRHPEIIDLSIDPPLDKKTQDYLNVIKISDGVTMRDGRHLNTEDAYAALHASAVILAKYNASNWWLKISRAKAIALSRNQKIRNRCKRAIRVLANDVFPILELIIPYDTLVKEGPANYAPIAREWMLALESKAIFLSEARRWKEALANMDRAMRVCVVMDDKLRLASTRAVFANSQSSAGLSTPAFARLWTWLKSLPRALGKSFAMRTDKSNESSTSQHPPESTMSDAKFLEHRRTMEKLWNEGAVDEAERLLSRLVATRPNDTTTVLDYASVLSALGRNSDAMVVLERALEYGEESRLLCNKGFVLNSMGRQLEAIPILKRSAELEPNDSFTWNNLGNSYYETNQLKEARSAYERAIAIDPNLTAAKQNLDNTLRRLNKQS